MSHSLLHQSAGACLSSHVECCVQLVGSVLAEDARPLPAELSAFLDQGLPDHHGQGAVFASPGTLALLTEDEVCSIAQGLVALDKHVLWKQDPQKLPGACQAS